MIDDMKKDNLLDDDFYERFIIKENERSTIYSERIGFPHLVNDASHKIVINIGVYPSHIIGPAAIIILLAIPQQLKDNEEYLIKIYNIIFNLASKPPNIALLAQIKEIDDFIDYLESED